MGRGISMANLKKGSIKRPNVCVLLYGLCFWPNIRESVASRTPNDLIFCHLMYIANTLSRLFTLASSLLTLLRSWANSSFTSSK